MSSWFNQNHRHHHHHHSNNVHIMIRLLRMYIYPHVISHMCAESWNETKRQRGRDAWGIPVTHVDIGNTLCSRGKSYRKVGKIYCHTCWPPVAPVVTGWWVNSLNMTLSHGRPGPHYCDINIPHDPPVHQSRVEWALLPNPLARLYISWENRQNTFAIEWLWYLSYKRFIRNVLTIQQLNNLYIIYT